MTPDTPPEILVVESTEGDPKPDGRTLYLAIKQGRLGLYGAGFNSALEIYGIPTRDRLGRSRSLTAILAEVDAFIAYALARPGVTFDVTPVGIDAGYTGEQMARMFGDAPENCDLPHGWRQ